MLWDCYALAYGPDEDLSATPVVELDKAVIDATDVAATLLIPFYPIGAGFPVEQ